MRAKVAEFSIERARRLSVLVAAAGTLAALAWRGPREAAGFLLGAALSVLSLQSWIRIAALADGEQRRSALGAGAFLALRFVLIGATVYVIVSFLGVTPAALIVGLLVSFAAVILELLYGLFKH